MRRRICSFGRGILSVAVIVGLIFGVLANATAADYYKDQVIIIICPATAGGGADVWARLVANNLGRFVPGNPTITVRNMPAAEALIAGNFVWNAKPDGKTLLLSDGRIIMANIMRPRGTEFDLAKMHPVYASPFGACYYFKPGLVREAKDIINTKGLIWGHDAPVSGVSGLFVFAKAFVGFESKDIMGYGGSGPAKLAFMSGETNCTGSGSDSYATSWKGDLERGTAVGLFQSGLLDPDGNVVKESSLPPIPTWRDIYEQIYGKAPSGPAWDAYKLILASRAYDNLFAMPPTTKPEYVSIVGKAFEDMAKDPEFLKQADRLAKGCTHIVGATLTRGYAARIGGTPETVRFFKKYVTEKYNIRFD